MLDAEQIQELLPHRYPMLLVDRILELQPAKSAIGIKNVSINEWFFLGHFPGRPIMPGVLIIEALAQVGAVIHLCSPEHRGKLAYFASLEKARFRKPVVPGDQLCLEVTVTWTRGAFGGVQGIARVGEEVVAEAAFTYSLVTPEGAPPP